MGKHKQLVFMLTLEELGETYKRHYKLYALQMLLTI